MFENLEIKEKTSPEVKCSKRPEIVEETLESLKTSFEKLEVENWEIPEEVEIVFKEKEETPLLGNVETENNNLVIVYDERFSTEEGDEQYTQELREKGIDYPGMKETLKHELAHVTMWSLTGIERQPSTRLIDEGWANLVQNTSEEGIPKEKFKKDVRDGLNSEKRENFEKALDFEKTLPERKELNTADSKVGTALLAWIHEKYGVEKMIELITKSPSISKNSETFKPVELDSRHKYGDEYRGIVEFFRKGLLSEQEAEQKLKEWEAKQFSGALEEVTGREVEDLKEEFLEWIESE